MEGFRQRFRPSQRVQRRDNLGFNAVVEGAGEFWDWKSFFRSARPGDEHLAIDFWGEFYSASALSLPQATLLEADAGGRLKVSVVLILHYYMP